MNNIKTKSLVLFSLIFLLVIIFISITKTEAQTFRSTKSRSPKIQTQLLKNNQIQLNWNVGSINKIEKVSVLRSVAPLGSIPLDPVWYPITRYDLKFNSGNGSFVDKFTADGTRYYYVLEIQDKSGKVFRSKPVSVKTYPGKLTPLSNPVIYIDKIHYVLSIVDNGKTVKRYNCCLGRNPFKRKLHQDCATTPEGYYSIIDLQPNYAYHKAYDLDYPRNIDFLRYEFASKEKLLPKRNGTIPGIGGEIQIHGGAKEMNSNWSFGCIMIKNSDIDELFKQRAIRPGTRVIITGWELTPADLKSINKKRSKKEIELIQKKLKKEGCKPGSADGVMGTQTMKALGRLQKKYNLPISCQLDTRTVKLLEKIIVN